MRNILLIYWLMAVTVQVQAQKRVHKKTHKVAMKSIMHSLCGTVVEKRGNQMPMGGQARPSGQPVMRDVAVFPVLTMDQVVSDESGFITDLKGAQPAQTVRSGKDGAFCFDKLPVGRYSVLIHEEKGWYANSFDTQNHINPVTLLVGKTATVAIQITHRAAF